MGTLKAVVRGGRLVIDEPVDLPEGTELELEIVDELDDAERRRRDEAIAASYRAYKAGEKGHSADEVIARLRSTK